MAQIVRLSLIARPGRNGGFGAIGANVQSVIAPFRLTVSAFGGHLGRGDLLFALIVRVRCPVADA